jgi:DNA polymerase-3 subunit delta'
MQRILGQESAIDLLQRALRGGRMHHGWIFSGPKGVGKFTTAIDLARILLDPLAAPDDRGMIGIDPAGETTRAIDAGTHPDLHVIRKEDALYSDNPDLRGRKLLNIPLDVLRERMLGGRTGDGRRHEAAAYRTAVRGAGKVFVIDEAELLEPIAQNAMLKTLEEPPPRTFIVLVTSRPERLLPTIRSRCHQARFDRLPPEAMRRWLESADLPDVDEAALRWIDRFCDGSPGMATLAAAYGFHRWQQQLEPLLADLERGRFPAAMAETLAALVEEFAAAWVRDHRNASKDSANKDGVRYVLGILAAHARSRLRTACGSGDDAATWARAIDLIRETEGLIERNVNVKLALADLVAQWSRTPAHAAT